MKITLKNFKTHSDFEHTFGEEPCLITGANGSGKSSIFQAVLFALFQATDTKKSDYIKFRQARGSVKLEIKDLTIFRNLSGPYATLVKDDEIIAENSGVTPKLKDIFHEEASKLFFQPSSFSLFELNERARKDAINSILGVDIYRKRWAEIGPTKTAFATNRIEFLQYALENSKIYVIDEKEALLLRQELIDEINLNNKLLKHLEDLERLELLQENSEVCPECGHILNDYSADIEALKSLIKLLTNSDKSVKLSLSRQKKEALSAELTKLEDSLEQSKSYQAENCKFEEEIEELEAMLLRDQAIQKARADLSLCEDIAINKVVSFLNLHVSNIFNQLWPYHNVQVEFDSNYLPTMYFDGRETIFKVASQGEKQLLTIATFFVLNKISRNFGWFFLDEPTANLNAECAEILAKWLSSQKNIVVISHQDIFTQYFNKIVEM